MNNYDFPLPPHWFMVKDPSANGSPVTSAKDVAAKISEKGYDRVDREIFVVMCLDTKHRIKHDEIVSVGTVDGSLIHPREIFFPAVRERASAVVVVHNHPSGVTDPSNEDREVTRRIRDAGKILGIPVLDHVIVGFGGKFFSFREEPGW